MTVTAASLILLPTRLMRYIKSSCTKKILTIHKMWGEHTATTFIKHNFVLKQQMQKHGSRRRKHWGHRGHQPRKQRDWGIVLKKKLLWCWQRQPVFKHTVLSLLQVQRGNDTATGRQTALEPMGPGLRMQGQGGSNGAGCLFSFSPPSYIQAMLQQCFEPSGKRGGIPGSCRGKRNNRWLSQLPFIIRGNLEPKLHPDCSGFLSLHLSEWYVDLYSEKISSWERDCNSLSFY